MMERHQFAWNEPPQIRAPFDVVDFRRTAIERFAPQRLGILLETSDQPRQLAESFVLRQMASQLEPFSRREPSGLPKFEAEVVRIERRLIDLVCHRGGL